MDDRGYYAGLFAGGVALLTVALVSGGLWRPLVLVAGVAVIAWSVQGLARGSPLVRGMHLNWRIRREHARRHRWRGHVFIRDEGQWPERTDNVVLTLLWPEWEIFKPPQDEFMCRVQGGGIQREAVASSRAHAGVTARFPDDFKGLRYVGQGRYRVRWFWPNGRLAAKSSFRVDRSLYFFETKSILRYVWDPIGTRLNRWRAFGAAIDASDKRP